MEKSEIQSILHAYRPEESPPTPEVGRALEAIGEDPGLLAWLETEQSFDRAFARALRGAEPPDGLAERIRDAREEELARQEQINALPSSPAAKTSFTRNLGRFPRLALPMAAALLLFAGILSVMLRPGTLEAGPIHPEVKELMATAGKYSGNPTHNHFQNHDLSELMQYLEEIAAPAPRTLPAGLRNLQGVGCGELSMLNHKVSLITMQGEETYYLFSVSRSHFPEQQDLREPLVRRIENHAAAIWTCGRLIYILIAETETQSLRAML